MSYRPLTACSDIADVDKLPRDGNFDVAIIDFHLGALKGTQIATMFGKTPVVLTSNSGAATENDTRWPRSITNFVHKKFGPISVLMSAINIGRQGKRGD